MKFLPVAGVRVVESELRGVQTEARRGLVGGVIDGVAGDGMPDVGTVNPQLVGAACDRL